ncbi:hypothetical protein [Nocardiopsis sp. NPDC006938]|uniref:hypothetical protein n=1 Tax=Nocardiopsis sp. NPDC006938 TaxID=3364337 RepID=UPI0036B2D2E8
MPTHDYKTLSSTQLGQLALDNAYAGKTELAQVLATLAQTKEAEFTRRVLQTELKALVDEK